MIKKFVDFFKANKDNPIKLDVNYLSNYIRDLMNNLGDLNGVDCRRMQKSIPNVSSDMFEYRYTIRFDLHNINIDEFKNEFKSILSHLLSEDLYIVFDDTKIKTDKHVNGILPKNDSMDSKIFWNVGHFITVVHNDNITI